MRGRSDIGVSVLTLLKGRRAHLDFLLQGLARMTPPPGELIVVDMAETPLTLPRLNFPARVESMPSAGLPLAAARNRAAKLARHGALCFLDVDCVVSRDSLAHALAALRRQDCVVAPDVRYLPAGAMHPHWHEADLARVALPHPARHFPPLGEVREPHPGFLWSVAFLMRARSFYDLGGFDEIFRGYGAEDTDLGFRAALAGLPLIYVGGRPIFHQHHTLHWPPLPHFADIVRNSVMFYRRYEIWPMLDRLRAFEALGYIRREADQITILRYPTGPEIAATRQGDDRLF